MALRWIFEGILELWLQHLVAFLCLLMMAFVLSLKSRQYHPEVFPEYLDVRLAIILSIV